MLDGTVVVVWIHPMKPYRLRAFTPVAHPTFMAMEITMPIAMRIPMPYLFAYRSVNCTYYILNATSVRG